MSISVYRIFVSSGWSGAGDLARLGAVLDRMPALLYRLDRVGDRELQQALGDRLALETALRIAMTQSHVALARISVKSAASLVELTERKFAHSGFRRHIPVIGIIDGEDSEYVDAAFHHVDRVVTLDADSLAMAIQELTEQAVADRRRANESLLSESPGHCAAQSKARELVPSLPYARIIEAFDELRASRAPANLIAH